MTPFAPFFVLFCYVIETSSTEDLNLLRELVASLSESRGLSESVAKLYRLMQVMVDIAGLYVEAKEQQLQDQTMVSIGDEFEMYLSQLGFMPTEEHAMSNNTPGDDKGQTTQIADWFSGNRNMMGLLEEDLSQIDAGRRHGSHTYDRLFSIGGISRIVAFVALVPGVALVIISSCLLRRLLEGRSSFQLDGRLGRLRSLLGSESALESAALEPRFPSRTSRSCGARGLLLIKGDADEAIRLGLCLPGSGAGVGIADHGLHVLESLLMSVIIAAKMCFELVHARVPLGAKIAVERPLGVACRRRLRRGQSLVSRRHSALRR